jgi:tRNA threonylcarbamoyladenosine biosynthesis protein TsaE
MSVEIRSLLRTEGETRAFGRHLGTLLRRGDWVTLIGALGSGKTTLVQGIVDGVHPGTRGRSPTYVLVEIYGEGPRIVHADLYRMAAAAEIETLGLDDLAEGDSVVLVEWADKAPDRFPDERLELELRYVPEGGRELRIRPRGSRWDDVAREGQLDREHWSHALYPGN